MQFNAGSLLFCCLVYCRIKKWFYICQTKTHLNIQAMNTQSLNTQTEYSDKYDNVVKCKIVSFVKVNGEPCVKVKSYSKYGNNGIKTIDVDYFCNNYIAN